MESLGEIELPPLFHGRYNIAPTQQVAVVRSDNPTKAVACAWGFTHPQSTTPVINARSETLNERPMFRRLVERNRCIIPADGFYEWKVRQPYHFQLPEKKLFGFAGLWQDDRCVIITRAADRSMKGIHDRMPMILPVNRWNEWLTDFHLPPAPILNMRPVSRRVNKVRHDDPACIATSEEQIDLSLFPENE